MIRVVFFGTPAFAVPFLRALAMDDAFSVVSVVSQPDKPSGRGNEVKPTAIKRADGSALQWQPASRHWHIVFVAPEGCGQPCVAMHDVMHRIWVSEGRHAEKLKVLWFGEVPAGVAEFSGFVPMQPSAELAALLPDASTPDALPAYLADANGYLVLRYAPGFNPSGLRKDLGRVLK